jgi:hypothetical protein
MFLSGSCEVGEKSGGIDEEGTEMEEVEKRSRSL